MALHTYELLVAVVAERLVGTIRALQADGTTGMHRESLLACTDLRGLIIPNAYTRDRAFIAAVPLAQQQVKGFNVYTD